MKRYMLDTNTVSDLIRRHPAVCRRVSQTPMTALCISAITGGELMFGLARAPNAKRLHSAVSEFLRRVDVLPWDQAVMERYGLIRAALENQGLPLGPLDMQIASHALVTDAILVTRDAAFHRVADLTIEDWTHD